MSFAPKQKLGYNPLVYKPSTMKPMAQDLELFLPAKIRVQGPISGDQSKLFDRKINSQPPKAIHQKLFQHEIKKVSNIQNKDNQYMSNCQTERQLMPQKKRVEGPMAGEQKSFATKYKVSNPIAEVKCYDLHKSYVTKTETPEFQYQRQKQVSQYTNKLGNYNQSNNMSQIISRTQNIGQEDTSAKIFQNKKRIDNQTDFKDVISQKFNPTQSQQSFTCRGSDMYSVMNYQINNTRPESKVQEKVQNIKMSQSSYLLTDVNNYKKCEIGTNVNLRK